jgi:hypothetical protein
MEEGRRPIAPGTDDFRRESMKMGLIARRSLQDRRLDLDEALGLKKTTESSEDM